MNLTSYMPLVSIITVCRNSQDTIARTINSVIRQSYANIEFIVIDGLSSDRTVSIIKNYSDHISQFVSEPDFGIYDAMNKGIAMSSGDIVGILNSDDFFYSDSTILDIVQAFRISRAQCVYGDLLYINRSNDGETGRVWKSSKFNLGAFSTGWNPPHPSFFVLRQAYIDFGSFNTKYKIAADFELMLRFLEIKKISSHYLPCFLVKMSLGGESGRSLRNIYKGNREIIQALRAHGINVFTISYLFRRL